MTSHHLARSLDKLYWTLQYHIIFFHRLLLLLSDYLVFHLSVAGCYQLPVKIFRLRHNIITVKHRIIWALLQQKLKSLTSVSERLISLAFSKIAKTSSWYLSNLWYCPLNKTQQQDEWNTLKAFCWIRHIIKLHRIQFHSQSHLNMFSPINVLRAYPTQVEQLYSTVRVWPWSHICLYLCFDIFEFKMPINIAMLYYMCIFVVVPTLFFKGRLTHHIMCNETL